MLGQWGQATMKQVILTNLKKDREIIILFL
jgi:hypothetical protein